MDPTRLGKRTSKVFARELRSRDESAMVMLVSGMQTSLRQPYGSQRRGSATCYQGIARCQSVRRKWRKVGDVVVINRLTGRLPR